MKKKFWALLCEILSQKTLLEIFRYGFITLISYFFLIIFIWFFTSFFGWNEKISYAFALTINYVGVYIGYNKFVFQTTHSMSILKRFMAVLVLSWFFNNLFFVFWIDVLHISYTIGVALNTVLLGAIRFLLQKFYVR